MTTITKDEATRRFTRAWLNGNIDECPNIFGADAPLFDVDSHDLPDRVLARPYKPNAYSTPFHADLTADVKVAVSPLGTGTTTMCVMDAMVYRPACLFLQLAKKQGDVRLVTAPWLVLRDGKDQARRTFMETFLAIVPDYVKFEVRQSADEVVTWIEKDGITVRTTFTFEAYNLPLAVARDKFQSTRPCGVIVIEYGKARRDVLGHLRSRVGRHDSGQHTLTPGVMLLEGNMPSPNSEVHKFYGGYPSSDIIGKAEPRAYGLKDEKPEGYCFEVPKGRQPDGTEYFDTRRVYHAPAGDCDNAQNLENTVGYTPETPRAYYNAMRGESITNQKWMMMGIGAGLDEGYRVFQAYNASSHIMREELVYGYEGEHIVLTYDQGLSGGCILWLERGRWIDRVERVHSGRRGGRGIRSRHRRDV